MRQQAIEALRADRVLTARQLSSYYGVQEYALRGLPSRDSKVHPVHMRPSEKALVRFYGLSQTIIDNSSIQSLSHLAGTAAMRRALDIPAADWTTLPKVQNQHQPDATYRTEHGIIAVEYDTGSYPAVVVAEKMRTFSEEYDGVVWGVVSGVRGKRLSRQYEEATFIDATWWK